MSGQVNIWNDLKEGYLEVLHHNPIDNFFLYRESYLNGFKKVGKITGLMAMNKETKVYPIPYNFKDDKRYKDLIAIQEKQTDKKPSIEISSYLVSTKEKKFLFWYTGNETVYIINKSDCELSITDQSLFIKKDVYFDGVGIGDDKIYYSGSNPFANLKVIQDNIKETLYQHEVNSMGQGIIDYTYNDPNKAFKYEQMNKEQEQIESKGKIGKRTGGN